MNFIYYLKELILFHRLNQELKKSVSLIIIELKNHSIEHTPTEIAAGGILLYINKKLSYHSRTIYMPGKLESIFIETVCSASSNFIVWLIYKQPSLQINKFTNDIIQSFLEKLNKKNSKEIFLLGDFDVSLLKYKTYEPVNIFVDIFSSNFLSPLILTLTRIVNSSSTAIDNSFCNVTFT